MSKQLTISATFSVLAMAALALVVILDRPASGGDAPGATAHGSIIRVLLRA